MNGATQPTERKSTTSGAWALRSYLLSVLIATAVVSLVGAVCAGAAAATTFNVTVAGNGNGVVSGSGIDCDNGATPGHEVCTTTIASFSASVELTAIPEYGSEFSGWTVSAGGQTPNPCGASITCKVALAFGTSNITATFNVSLPPPNVAIQTPVVLGPDEAIFHGSVDPNGNDAAWRFEYHAVGASTWTDAPVPDGDASAGTGPEPVEATVGGLEPNTGYEVRLHAANASTEETSGVETFYTPGKVPAIGVVTAWSVTDSIATLAASLDPNNAAIIDCRFEYGPTTGYGSIAPCSPQTGAGTGPVQVTARIGALAPESVYHVRLVARSGCSEGCGSTEGTDSVFSTRSEAEVGFPARGYELVSAADTNGVAPLPDQSSPDGKDFIWLTAIPSPGAQNGTATYFRALRASTAPGPRGTSVRLHHRRTNVWHLQKLSFPRMTFRRPAR
jgi:hypothetical protein